MRIRKDHVWRFLALMGASVPALRSDAADASNYLVFSRGPFLMRPRVALAESYNDNLFSQPDGTGDLITSVSPGLNLQLGRQSGNHISLDYGFSEHFYLDRSDLNSGEHRFGLQTRLQGKRLILTGSDSLQFLSSPIGLVSFVSATPPPVDPGQGTGGGGGGSGGGDPITVDPGAVQGGEVITSIGDRNVDRTTFSDNYNLGYGISEKTGVYLQGSHSATDFENGVVLYDLTTVRATGGFGYRAFPKVSLFGELFYRDTSTTPNFPGPENPDLSAIGGFLGARGNFTPKLSGTVRVGYEQREASNGADVPSAPVADLSLSHRFSDKTSMSLNFSRINDVSVQFASQVFTANTAGLQLSQALGSSGKWRSNVGVGYSMFKYETLGVADANTDFDQFSANFGLAYQIQMWLSASLGYSFIGIRSDSAGIPEYDVNQIGLSLSLGY
ncbi:MAG: outer membrane beta-barrel protein [Verrucomicrobia bacterium]|nr:outer membrane beta-barrel protein [Verrucomicrobiota bacterium]